jgi:hypothetical protein
MCGGWECLKAKEGKPVVGIRGVMVLIGGTEGGGAPIPCVFSL